MNWVPILPEAYFQTGNKTVFEKGKEWNFDYIKKLHIELEYYDETPIMNNDFCYIINETLKEYLSEKNCDGFYFDEVVTTFDEQYENMDEEIPNLYWLKITGKINNNDLFEKKFGRKDKADLLMISEKVVKILKEIDKEYYELIRKSADQFIEELENS